MPSKKQFSASQPSLFDADVAGDAGVGTMMDAAREAVRRHHEQWAAAPSKS